MRQIVDGLGEPTPFLGHLPAVTSMVDALDTVLDNIGW